MKCVTLGTAVIGAAVTTIATVLSTRPLNEEEKMEVWEKTRFIDNPLQPWAEIYGKSVLKTMQTHKHTHTLHIRHTTRL